MSDKPPAPPQCAWCAAEFGRRLCMDESGQPGKLCPTLTHGPALAQANQAYGEPGVMEFARQASIQEAACYANRHQRPYTMQPTKPRVVEIAEFARRMGYERLGLAFCVGLAKEAALVADTYEAWGFEVASVCCKAGRTDKQEFLGLGEEHKIFQGAAEAMCNPVFQAQALNQAGTELNVLLGLCVGHDSLFIQHAAGPTTVLAVKDRVTGHNPLAALYTAGTYYRRIKDPELA